MYVLRAGRSAGSLFVAKYEAYVREMKAQKKEPVTMLAYLVEMVQ